MKNLEGYMKAKSMKPVFGLTWKIIFPIFLLTAILGASIVVNAPVFAAERYFERPNGLRVDYWYNPQCRR